MCSFSGAFLCNPPSGAVVPTLPEFTLNFGATPLFNVNIEASCIAITGNLAFGIGAGESVILGSLDDDSGRDIVGIANFATSGTTGITASDVSFAPHSVTFDFSNSGWGPGSSATFDLVIAPAAAAPKPASLALLGVGFAAVGWAHPAEPSGPFGIENSVGRRETIAAAGGFT
jgi:hypothetical protein